MQQCTMVLDMVHSDGEEKLFSCNTRAMHPQLSLVGINKDGIILGWAVSLGSNSVHILTVHAASPTKVTGCIEGGDGRGIDVELVQ